RHPVDVRHPRRVGQPGPWVGLHHRAGAHPPEGVVGVRRPAGDRRHRPAHRLPHSSGEQPALPLEGNGMSEEAPHVAHGSGEPGTVAVTLPTASRPATYTHEPSAETPKLRVSHVSITYISRSGQATEAVRDISFDIHDKPGEGEIVVFLGPSGCGKSTILKAIAGLLVPTEGEIQVEGKPVEDVGRDRGMVFQAYTSFGWLTVRENLEYGLRLQGIAKAERRERSDKYLKSVGLSEFADRYPKDLSGGMKQR